MKKVFLVICLMGLVGCADPVETRKKQDETSPTLICTKDGVKVWCVFDHYNSQRIYFTTPAGDVQCTTPGNDDHPPIINQTGSGAKKK